VVERLRWPLRFDKPVSFSLLCRSKGSILPYCADAPEAPPPDPADPLACQPFARFVRASDGFPPFQQAAVALARATAAVVAEAGPEAQQEGSSLFKSIDVLASTAYAWCFRKADEPRTTVVGDHGDTRHACREAEAMDKDVRGVFALELEREQERIDAAGRAAAIADAFPALGEVQRNQSPDVDELLFPLEESEEVAGQLAGMSSGDGRELKRKESSTASHVGPSMLVAGTEETAGQSGAGSIAGALAETTAEVDGACEASADASEPSAEAQREVAGVSEDLITTTDGPAIPDDESVAAVAEGRSGASDVQPSAQGVASKNQTEQKEETPQGHTNAAQPQPQESSAKRTSFMPCENGVYWFYQSSDGSSLFLHPLNVRVWSFKIFKQRSANQFAKAGFIISLLIVCCGV
jgi:hypothetical protein